MKFFLLIVCVLQLTLSYTVFAETNWYSVESSQRSITITGFTRARSKMPLINEVEGKVAKIFADIGEPISAENKFACLDDAFVQLDIQSATNEIIQNNIDIKYFTKQVKRHQSLVKKQSVSVSVLDGLQRDLANAKQALNAVVIRRKRLKELQQRHCISAPEGWLVIDRSIEQGQWVNKGDVVGNIGDYSRLKVPLTLTEQELASLQAMQKNIVIKLSERNKKVSAAIEHISPAFDEKSHKVQVDLLLKDRHPEFRGGMRAELILNIPDASNSFIISRDALEERFEEYWLERKDGKRIRVKLLSNQDDGKAKIKSPEIKLGDLFKKVRS